MQLAQEFDVQLNVESHQADIWYPPFCCMAMVWYPGLPFAIARAIRDHLADGSKLASKSQVAHPAN